MFDLIIFLCFVLFMVLAVCWIQAIEIEKKKERIKYLKESNELYYNALKFENSDVDNACCEHHPNASIDPETGELV